MPRTSATTPSPSTLWLFWSRLPATPGSVPPTFWARSPARTATVAGDPFRGRRSRSFPRDALHTPNLVHCPVHIPSQVEVVIDDLLRRPGHIAECRVPIGFPHIHRHRFHRRTLFRRQSSPKSIQAVLYSIIFNGQDPRLASVHPADDGDVLVPPANGFLVNAQPLNRQLLAPGQPPVNSPLLNPVGFLPTDPQDVTCRRRRTLQQHVNRQSLKQSRKPAQGFGPRHLYHLCSVRLALHPRHVGYHDGLVLATIQVPPSSSFRPMDVHSLSALRAAPHRLRARHFNFNRAFIPLQRYRLHRPRRPQAIICSHSSVSFMPEVYPSQ